MSLSRIERGCLMPGASVSVEQSGGWFPSRINEVVPLVYIYNMYHWYDFKNFLFLNLHVHVEIGLKSKSRVVYDL